MPDINCQCGSSEWSNPLTKEYGGHKGSRKRDETVMELYKCKDCGAEGRKFLDGVDGGATLSGVFR